jgi:rubrerythrin
MGFESSNENQNESDLSKKEGQTDSVDELKNKKEESKDDGLSFDCEICGDRPGGCPTCGWGKGL